MKKLTFISLLLLLSFSLIAGSAKTDYAVCCMSESVTSMPVQVFKKANRDEFKKPKYTDEELFVLSHVITGEAGSKWLTDREQLLVGNVVMNRVVNPHFPDTIEGVIFQNGQYACTWDGNYYREPDERTINNAKRILKGERFCPESVIYQSNHIQGEIFEKIDDTYFCYE